MAESNILYNVINTSTSSAVSVSSANTCQGSIRFSAAVDSALNNLTDNNKEDKMNNCNYGSGNAKINSTNVNESITTKNKINAYSGVGGSQENSPCTSPRPTNFGDGWRASDNAMFDSLTTPFPTGQLGKRNRALYKIHRLVNFFLCLNLLIK